MIPPEKQYLTQNGYSRSFKVICFDANEKPLGDYILKHNNCSLIYERWKCIATTRINKKLSYCWETVRRESMPRIAEMDVEMTT